MTAILELRGVGKRFGAFSALRDVAFDVGERETVGLIGPNGAGKTTLFNVITGFLRPDEGSIRLAGQSIDGMAPAQRVARGLARTFQTAMVFPGLTARENIAMAVRQHAGDGLRWFGGARAASAAAEIAVRLLGDAGLAHRAETPLRDMSHGERRIVDALMSLALSPRLLLLDEPTAGLTRAESDRLLGILRRNHADTALLLVAHDIDIVFGHCDRVVVMELGRVIGSGTPAEVREDAEVRRAYLGSTGG
ncbi:ATP-binding cassette domain-containing protein [Roseomonas eburnea]|uniref:ATP-binding cassette domain-containing protein n=1 Tax=Neoroseomonas eburnea TaxID=1346889 RepID=A0A9X9X9R2_9PROT|nr:ATP-binding cassette domain-containing protein [Neoroseomonas eburnea]MBR0680448.1 ATP-binding cassette domain-containing protein [Neoroseomonas eburnea]